MASQSAAPWRGVCVMAFCFLLSTGGDAQSPGAETTVVPSPGRDHTKASARPRYVREFASAEDVKRAHPVLDRTLDIIAGPKKQEIAVHTLQNPYAVTTDSRHRAFVTDVSARKVHVFDFEHSKYSLLQDDADRLRRPVGVAIDRDGSIYVSDTELGTILVYDSEGKFRRFLKETKGKESYFEGPWGIAIDPIRERIYICDYPRHMVIVADKKGRILNRFGKRGGGKEPGEFRFPTQVVAAGDEVVVLDSGNNRLQILDVLGHFRREIRLPDADNRSGLAVDDEGNIYVSNSAVNQVYVFSRDGGLLYAFGGEGTKAGMFNGASGMWMDSERFLYVVDAQNKRVQVFQVRRQNPNDSQ